MEKKQNSAVDKVEDISALGMDAQPTPIEDSEGEVPSKAKTPVNRAKTAQKKTRVERISDAKREQMRVEKQKQREYKRIEAKREKEERAESIAAKRLREREARKARRDYLKSESAEARRDRIAAERREAMRLKKEKAVLRARMISEERERRAVERERRRAVRVQEKREKRTRGVGGWIAAVVSLGCAVLILGTLLTFNLMYMSDSKQLLGSSYERAYYDLAGCIDNIDVNLSKLEVTSSPALQQRLLTDIIVQSELAESELQALPLEDESKYATGKYINQLGDYSKMLSYKIASGGEITDDDMEMLYEFHRRNGNLQSTLSKISKEKGKSFNFTSLLKPEKDNAVISNFGELENNSVEYPKMIYDGPFSDGLEVKQARGLKESEITRAQAAERFNALFADYRPKDAEVVNEGEGSLATYNVEAATESGYYIYAQMAKRGGRLVLFNCYEPCEEEKFTLDECREIAEVFVKKAGFEDMAPVWESSSRAVAQFNFAHVKDGVVVYPDLVKVNVCMERGLVSAVEATSYYYNHTDREIPEANISRAQAEAAVSPSLNVTKVRKAVIPVGDGKETLAYEVFGESGGRQFFVYVDAVSGVEREIFEVVETEEGRVII